MRVLVYVTIAYITPYPKIPGTHIRSHGHTRMMVHVLLPNITGIDTKTPSLQVRQFMNSFS
jgi:hypothetical protein